jgi:hypothetical protein
VPAALSGQAAASEIIQKPAKPPAVRPGFAVIVADL